MSLLLFSKAIHSTFDSSHVQDMGTAFLVARKNCKSLFYDILKNTQTENNL